MWPKGDAVAAFFNQHVETLSSLHPGLTQNTLKRELLWFDEFCGFKLELASIFSKLLQGQPLAQVIGYSYFYDAVYKVTEHTLIPRPETELLIEKACAYFSSAEHLSFVDMGTGTGAIALSLARQFKSCDAALVDISPAALEVARANAFAQAYHFSHEHKFAFIESDRLQSVSGEFDLIVTNPPYIKRHADFSQVHPQVAEYEPALALFLEDEDYTDWFQSLFAQAAAHLKPKGVFIMEGHEAHLDELASLMGSSKQWTNINVTPDLTGRPRFLESRKDG